MAAMLETIGSFVLAMMITLSVMRLEYLANYGNTKAQTTYILQIYGENLRKELRSAFAKAGYDVEDKTAAIVTCTSSAFTFKTDLNADGTTETNYISVTSLPTGTTPKLSGDQQIKFTLNGRTKKLVCPGLTHFTMTYYNTAMSATTTASAVKLVSFKYIVSSTEPVSYKKVGNTRQPIYAYAWVEDRVFLKNLFTKY
jgi:hypothetical protein